MKFGHEVKLVIDFEFSMLAPTTDPLRKSNIHERNKNNQNNLHIHEHPLHSTAGRYPGVKVISVYS